MYMAFICTIIIQAHMFVIFFMVGEKYLGSMFNHEGEEIPYDGRCSICTCWC